VSGLFDSDNDDDDDVHVDDDNDDAADHDDGDDEVTPHFLHLFLHLHLLPPHWPFPPALRWVNEEGLPANVKGLAVGGTGILGVEESGALTVNEKKRKRITRRKRKSSCRRNVFEPSLVPCVMKQLVKTKTYFVSPTFKVSSYAFCTPPRLDDDGIEDNVNGGGGGGGGGVRSGCGDGGVGSSGSISGDNSGGSSDDSGSVSGLDSQVLDGDGVTPVESALAMPGTIITTTVEATLAAVTPAAAAATTTMTTEKSGSSDFSSDSTTSSSSNINSSTNVETLRLQGVTHFPWSDVFGASLVAPVLANKHKNEGLPWYGSPEALDQWAPWLAGACGCSSNGFCE
jgi:hypothetical protein